MPTSPQRETLADALKWHDDDSRPARVERIEWASAVYQPSGIIAGGLLPLGLMEEARLCFVNGQFMAALLCATSVAEHLLVEELEAHDQAGGQSTLGPSIKSAREKRLLPAATCEKLEQLNNLRNPLAHRRDPRDPSTLTARYRAKSVHPNAALEADARFALEVMYEVFERLMKRIG